MAELEPLPELEALPSLDPLPHLDPLPELDALVPLDELEPLEPMAAAIAPPVLSKPVVKANDMIESKIDGSSGVLEVSPVTVAHEHQFTQSAAYATEGVVIVRRQEPALQQQQQKSADKKKTNKFSLRKSDETKPKEQPQTTQQQQQQKPQLSPGHEMGDPKDYFRIENWYDDLKSHTFNTAFVDLTLEEARVIMRYRESHKMFMQLTAWQIKEGKIAKPQTEAEYREIVDKELTAKLKPEDVSAIDGIVNKLNSAIAALNCKHGAFVRLSTRSPKDSALSSEKMKSLVRSAIQESKITDLQEAMNEDLNIFVTACSESLRVDSGKEAMDLLLHSNRVMEDLMRCELALKDVWSMKLIVREWWKGLYPPFEFRCFVYDQQMTAITQYYSLCYLRQMVENKAEIQRIILAYWTALKHKIKKDSYTIDFALSRDLKEVWVVELNHLPPTAGTALFDFMGNAADRAQIETGKAPGKQNASLEFRIRTGICPNIAANSTLGMSAIHPPIRTLLDELRGRPPYKPKTGSCCIS